MSGLVVVGAGGRMGQRVVALAGEYGLTVEGAVGREGLGGVRLGGGLGEGAVGRACVVDFSVVAQVEATLEFARARGLPVVMGTTGLGAAEEAALAAAAAEIPVLRAANFSLGIHVLRRLVREAGGLLGVGWDVEVVEAHHRRKIDAPSGTAWALVEAVREGRGEEGVVQVGRSGVGLRGSYDEIGVHSVRGGSVVGEHAVRFLGEGEEVALEHRALTRDVFVRGALAAARWMVAEERAPGRYGLDDVVRGLG